MKTRIILLILLLAGACRPSFDKSETLKEIKIDRKILTQIDEHNPFSKIRLIKINSQGKYYLGSFKKILEFNNQLFILDDKSMVGKKIFVIDFAGNVVQVLDKTGKGPGEYVSITDMDIDEKSGDIFVVDQIKQSILVYNNNFVYKKSIKPTIDVPFNLLSYAEKTKSFILNKGNGRLMPDFNYHMFQIDMDGHIIQKLFPYEKIYSTIFGGSMRMWSINESVDYLPGFSNSIFRVKSDTCYEAYRFVSNDPTLSSIDYETTRETNLGIYNQSFIESEKFIIFRWKYQNDSFFTIYDKVNDIAKTFLNSQDPTCGCGTSYRFTNFIEDNKVIMIANNLNISYILSQIDIHGVKVVNPEAIADLSKGEELNEQILIVADICLN